LEGRGDYLGDLDVDERIIIIYILSKLLLDRLARPALLETNEISGSAKGRKFLTKLSDFLLIENNP
jgi:hypothetical protein